MSLELMLLAPGLLQTDEIRLLPAQPAEQALLGRRADATDVDGDYAHGAMIWHAAIPAHLHRPRVETQRAALRALHAQVRTREPLLLQRGTLQRWGIGRAPPIAG